MLLAKQNITNMVPILLAIVLMTLELSEKTSAKLPPSQPSSALSSSSSSLSSSSSVPVDQQESESKLSFLRTGMPMGRLCRAVCFNPHQRNARRHPICLHCVKQRDPAYDVLFG